MELMQIGSGTFSTVPVAQGHCLQLVRHMFETRVEGYLLQRLQGSYQNDQSTEASHDQCLAHMTQAQNAFSAISIDDQVDQTSVKLNSILTSP